MRKLKIKMLASLLVLLGLGIAYAATTYDITVTAQIPAASPDLTIIIKELSRANQNPWEGVDVSAMNFATLTHLFDSGAEAGVWYAKKYYCVIAFPSSFGKKYEIKSSCPGLTSGSNTLKDCFVLTPQYTKEDEWSPGNPQGDRPTGSTPGPAVIAAGGTDKSIYRSDDSAKNIIMRAFYSIPNTSTVAGFTYIPLSQAPGTYSGTVTITIASI